MGVMRTSLWPGLLVRLYIIFTASRDGVEYLNQVSYFNKNNMIKQKLKWLVRSGVSTFQNNGGLKKMQSTFMISRAI